MSYEDIIRQKDEEIKELKQQLQDSQARYAHICNTLSWKITAPLRKAGYWIKYLKRPSDIDVIIPTYNGGERFKEVLDALEKQKTEVRLRIVVIDSQSSDRTLYYVRHSKLRKKIIKIKQTDFSHSATRQKAATISKAPIIVFMVQDAIPDNDMWLQHLIKPLENDNIVACSCFEHCPIEAELYYRVSSFEYLKWIGVSEADVIGSYRDGMNTYECRKNAALNDVACAIKRDIYLKYGHRGEFAEDLDLGLRLIKDGYKIKLLSSITVEHYHNRRPSYYLVRAVHDKDALNERIFPESGEQWHSLRAAAGLIVQTYYVMTKVVENLVVEDVSDIDAIIDAILDQIHQYEIQPFATKVSCRIDDDVLNSVYEYMYSLNAGDCMNVDNYMLQEIWNFIHYCVRDFLHTHDYIQETFYESVVGCFIRKTAAMIGDGIGRVKSSERPKELNTIIGKVKV